MSEVTRQRRPVRSLLMALILSTLISVALFAVRILTTHTIRYWFMVWNVFLAWLPLLLAMILGANLKNRGWGNWQNIGLGLLWLAFLPNSFYLVSDLIHIHSSGEVNVLYDVALFSSFAFNGLCLGFGSLFLMHRFWLRRMRTLRAHLLVAVSLLLSSFAIYLGRELRWNTWDVVVNPAGLLLNISDRIVNPSAYIQTFVNTATFFALLGSMYLVLWQVTAVLRQHH